MDNRTSKDAETAVSASKSGFNRREWVQRLLAGAGAGLASPAIVEAHWAELDAARSATSETAATGEWKPQFLNHQQSRTLTVMAERIVPGSEQALVNRFLDGAMSVSTHENQQKFLAAMYALEGEALRQFSKSFLDLSPDTQDAVLSAASTGKTADATLDPVKETKTGTQPAIPTLRDYFEYLKTWVSTAYYSTEMGMKELGWNGENFFESYPGCDHEGRHSSSTSSS